MRIESKCANIIEVYTKYIIFYYPDSVKNSRKAIIAFLKRNGKGAEQKKVIQKYIRLM